MEMYPEEVFLGVCLLLMWLLLLLAIGTMFLSGGGA